VTALSDGLEKLEQIVKPLIWDGDFVHTSLGTFYHVNHATGVPSFVVLERNEGAMVTKSAWPTVDEAKAAAQAHFNQAELERQPIRHASPLSMAGSHNQRRPQSPPRGQP